MDIKGQISPILPLQKGGCSDSARRLAPRIPLFGKEGLGEIFPTMCLLNYGLLSKF